MKDNETDLPDRARFARVKASGSRTAARGEVPRSKGVLSNLVLMLPQVRPRWGPRYAVDGSPLTMWASREIDSLPWIELELGNQLRPCPMVSAIEIKWSASQAPPCHIVTSPDGFFWKPVYQREKEGPGHEIIRLSGPVPVQKLRLEINESAAPSVAAIDIKVFGDQEEEAPSPPEEFVASASGANSARLGWEQHDDGVTFFYKAYRSETGLPSRSLENLVEVTSRKQIHDHGLKPDTDYNYLVVAETFAGKTAAVKEAVRVRTKPGKSFHRFARRGIVEGFYNSPWPHQARLDMIEFLEDAGMNYYIYAPKMDSYHRQYWRKPYPEEELELFAELAARSKAHNVTFSYGVSPGLDFNFKSKEEMDRLQEKLESIFDTGVRSFTLCFDDIPGVAGKAMAERQVRMVNQTFDYLHSLDPATELLFVPTVYSHTYSHYEKRRSWKARYLRELANLRPEVAVMWTGPGTVFSPRIKTDGARELQELWNRPVHIWDNYPVNDVGYRFNIFTGPYSGRDADLQETVGGIFLNPMHLPHASKIALFTAGRYMNREDYDRWQAYDEALRFLGRDEKGYHALKTVSDCLIPHPVFKQLSVEDMPLYQAIEDFWQARESGSNYAKAKNRLQKLFESYVRSPSDLEQHLDDKGLADDLMPASQKLSIYGEAGLKCLELVESTEETRKLELRREILELQARAGIIPWRVAEEPPPLSYISLGSERATRNVMENFIAGTLLVMNLKSATPESSKVPGSD